MKFFSFSTYPKLSQTSVLAAEALLLAMYLALGFLTIPLGPTLRITFSFLAMALSCYLFGFWPNVPFALAADLFGYLLKPDGAYMPLFMLTALSNVLIYSFFFFFKKKISLPTVILAKGVQVLFCNLLLNPLILQLMYDMPFWALFSERLVKNLVEFPIDVALLYLILQFASRLISSRSWLKQIKERAEKKGIYARKQPEKL